MRDEKIDTIGGQKKSEKETHNKIKSQLGENPKRSCKLPKYL